MKNLYLLCVGTLIQISLIAQQGPLSGGSFANTPLAGSNKQWTSVTNVATSDNTYASFGNLTGGLGGYTDYLAVTNFGFGIPVNSIITGIEVRIERSDPNQRTSDFHVQLINQSGTIGGADRATATLWPAADAIALYGNTADLWGQTWTATDINSTNFGVAISAQRGVTGSSTQGRIDHVTITVYFNLIPLPLKLLSFSLQKDQNSIHLTWATAEESNMDRFVIERSNNGRDFASLGSIPTRNQLTQNNYSFEDKQPLKNISYYRLKMVGSTGDISYSKVIPVRFSTGSTVTLYPVPWHRGTPLNIVNPNNEKLTVQFFNEKGQLVSSTTTVSSVIPSKALVTFKGWASYKIFDENHQLLGVGKILVAD